MHWRAPATQAGGTDCLGWLGRQGEKRSMCGSHPSIAANPRGRTAAKPKTQQVQMCRRKRLAGAAGFEPANAGTKNRCLTTWRRPSRCIRDVRERAGLYLAKAELEVRSH